MIRCRHRPPRSLYSASLFFSSLLFFLFHWSPWGQSSFHYGHISAYSNHDFSSSTQVIFTDTSVPPLPSLSVETEPRHTRHSFRLWASTLVYAPTGITERRLPASASRSTFEEISSFPLRRNTVFAPKTRRLSSTRQHRHRLSSSIFINFVQQGYYKEYCFHASTREAGKETAVTLLCG